MAIGKFLAKLNPANNGVMPRVAETVEYGVGMFTAGYAQNRWRQKASVGGVPLDLGLGALLKVVGLGLDLWKPSRYRTLHCQAHLLGNVGLGAFMHTLGAGHGAKTSGVARFLVPSGSADKVRKAIPEATILGEIPKAPHGDLLSNADLAALARG